MGDFGRRVAEGVLDVEDRFAVAMIGARDRAVAGHRDQARPHVDEGEHRRRRQRVELTQRGQGQAAARDVGSLDLAGRLAGLLGRLGDHRHELREQPRQCEEGEQRADDPNQRRSRIEQFGQHRPRQSGRPEHPDQLCLRAEARLPGEAERRHQADQRDRQPGMALRARPGPPEGEQRADRADDRQIGDVERVAPRLGLERLDLPDIGEPQPLEFGRDLLGAAEALREADDEEGGNDPADRYQQGKAARPPGRRHEAQPEQQRRDQQQRREIDRRQHVADHLAVVPGREAGIGDCTAATERDRIARHPPRFLAVPHPAQRDRGAGDRHHRDQLEPNAERHRRRQPGGHPAAPAVGIGEPRDHQQQHRELPAMMIDAQRHPHEQAGLRAQQDREGDRIGARVNQPADREDQRPQPRAERQHRRHRARDPIGGEGAENRLEDQQQRGDRQVDDPRPVDVEPVRRRQLVLPKIEPALAVQPRPDLREAHIVVGVAEREPVYLAPFILEEIGAGTEEHQPEERAPAPLDPGHHPLFEYQIGAVPHRPPA